MQQSCESRLSVSVIIPTYNRAAFIGQAIDSVLQQTRVPDEIIVVDDGSTDETPAILAQYGAPVRVIRQENRGRSAARNLGLRESRGDLIVFLDSDDLLTPTSIECRLRVFENSSDVGVVYGNMYVMDMAGKRLGLSSQYMPGVRPSGFVLGDLALRGSFILIPAMVRRSVLGDHTFDVTLERCEDYDLWRRLAAKCQFQFVDEPIGCYRMHHGNTILSQAQKMDESVMEVQRRIFDMPEFAALSRCERTRAYCANGAKSVRAGNVADGKHYFLKAICASPWRPTSYLFLLLSLLSPRLLSGLFLLRRGLTRKSFSTTVPPNPFLVKKIPV